MKYNELKVQCLLAEKLLSELKIVVNVKTLSVLLNKKESNIAQHINRMSPTYYTRYADNERSYGCVLKYRAPTKRAKKTLEKLCMRFLLEQHLNLKKYPMFMDYTGFYFFEGIDNFKDVFEIDLRKLILDKYVDCSDLFYTFEHRYQHLFNRLSDKDETRPSDFILGNYKRYHPYTDKTVLNSGLELIAKYRMLNNRLDDDGDIRQNQKEIERIENIIEFEKYKLETFTGTFEGSPSPQDTINKLSEQLTQLKAVNEKNVDSWDRREYEIEIDNLEDLIEDKKDRLETFTR